jgi:hypothetical protein
LGMQQVIHNLLETVLFLTSSVLIFELLNCPFSVILDVGY